MFITINMSCPQGELGVSLVDTVRFTCWDYHGDKRNIRHSLRTLEARGWIEIGSSSGGQAAEVVLTRAGRT